MEMRLAARIFQLFSFNAEVTSIELTGSRKRGDPTLLSDWDFLVGTNDFDGLAGQLPGIVAPLSPLAQQWDRLSTQKCYMLVIRGPHKIDFLLPAVPNSQEAAWPVSTETLEGIDSHFWDWVLWLGSKQLRGQSQLVRYELRKLSSYLLVPMGAATAPTSIASAIVTYTDLRRAREAELDVTVRRELQDEVEPALRREAVI